MSAGAGDGARIHQTDHRRKELSSRRTLLKASVVAAGATLMAGCGGDDSAPATTRPRGITVTDQRGKTIVFDQPVTRAVTIPIPAASMLIAIDGSPDRLVGMQEASWTAIRDGIMGTMFPAALKVRHDVANEEFAPNVESILALDPDVVVQWGDHGSEVITPLENAGLTVLGLSYGTQADLTAWIRLFAAITGQPERGRTILSQIDARLRDTRSAGSAERGTPPKVLYFLRYADGLEVAGTETYNDFYISLIGATNPATGSDAVQGFATVDVEQVLAWDPDIILLGNFDAAVPADVYRDDVWRAVSAVRTRRVYKVPFGGYRWDPPGQESPLMWRWLSDVAFAIQKGTRSDLRARIVSSYQFLYRHTPDPSQIDDILWTDVNSGSSHYRELFSG
ncbi:MAG: ABC transporter substrate-binding protein [Nocardioidaceae bacterium]